MDKFQKLSQAIEVGCSAHRKCCNEPCREKNGEIVATCALGSALIAIGVDPREKPAFWFLSDRFSIPDDILFRVLTLNDELHWSRQRIAKWLKKQGY